MKKKSFLKINYVYSKYLISISLYQQAKEFQLYQVYFYYLLFIQKPTIDPLSLSILDFVPEK